MKPTAFTIGFVLGTAVGVVTTLLWMMAVLEPPV